MWNTIVSSGMVTMSADFTQAMWPLKAGLLGLLALSAGGIVSAALQYHLSQKTKVVTETPQVSYRLAA